MYVISNCPLGSPQEEFVQKVCSIVCDKKQVREYVVNRLIIDNWQHYMNWVQLHYGDNLYDDPHRKETYVKDVVPIDSGIRNFSFIEKIYNPADIASILRVSNKFIPVGASYEYDSEIRILQKIYEDILKDVDLSKKE